MFNWDGFSYYFSKYPAQEVRVGQDSFLASSSRALSVIIKVIFHYLFSTLWILFHLVFSYQYSSDRCCFIWQYLNHPSFIVGPCPGRVLFPAASLSTDLCPLTGDFWEPFKSDCPTTLIPFCGLLFTSCQWNAGKRSPPWLQFLYLPIERDPPFEAE